MCSHLAIPHMDQGLLRRHRHRELGSWRRAGRDDDVNRSIGGRDSQGCPGLGSLRDGDGRHRHYSLDALPESEIGTRKISS